MFLSVVVVVSFIKHNTLLCLKLEELAGRAFGGHVYGVATTRSLTNPQWATQKVKKTETDAEREQVMPSADEEDVGMTTIYVVPAEGATSQFFKLEAK